MWSLVLHWTAEPQEALWHYLFITFCRKSSIRECGVCATVIPVKDPDICSLSQKKLCDLNISCSTRDMQCSPFVSSYWIKKLIKSISQGIYFETRIKVTNLSVANPRVRQGRALTSSCQIFFIFMQFSENILQNNKFPHLPRELAPLGNPGSATAYCSSFSTACFLLQLWLITLQNVSTWCVLFLLHSKMSESPTVIKFHFINDTILPDVASIIDWSDSTNSSTSSLLLSSHAVMNFSTAFSSLWYIFNLLRNRYSGTALTMQMQKTTLSFLQFSKKENKRISGFPPPIDENVRPLWFLSRYKISMSQLKLQTLFRLMLLYRNIKGITLCHITLHTTQSWFALNLYEAGRL